MGDIEGTVVEGTTVGTKVGVTVGKNGCKVGISEGAFGIELGISEGLKVGIDGNASPTTYTALDQLPPHFSPFEEVQGISQLQFGFCPVQFVPHTP